MPAVRGTCGGPECFLTVAASLEASDGASRVASLSRAASAATLSASGDSGEPPESATNGALCFPSGDGSGSGWVDSGRLHAAAASSAPMAMFRGYLGARHDANTRAGMVDSGGMAVC